MAGGFTVAKCQSILDAEFPTSAATTHIAYSANGTSESAALVRTPIGATGWKSATAATPSVKGNSNVLTSSAATAGVTITHWALYSALSAGTQITEWEALAASKTLAIGDKLEWAIDACKVTLD